MDKVLEVKDLRISFKTNGGTVKAVRGISFSLFKERTLAIVGESGSGKSVTSKAILGILANNKIVEGGQIIYDGKDLLQISEESFSKLRGVKISMIFQDPLSSLNPIMIVGKQLTEAMMLKKKAALKESKKALKKVFSVLYKIDESRAKDLESFLREGGKVPEKEALSIYASLFRDAAKLSLEERKAKVQEAIEALEAYENAYLTDGFDLKAAYKGAKGVFPLVLDCDLSISNDPDDVITTFKTVLKDVLNKEKRAVKLRKKREKHLTKYGADTLYDLPAEVRAAEPEIVISLEESREAYQAAVDGLVDHLKSLLTYSEEDVDRVADNATEDILYAMNELLTPLTKAMAKERAISLLREVGIDEPERRFRQYPFELSGGMRQRIVIAIALSSSPEVLICDEPTTALDVTIQAQILELINKLKAERKLSIVFITHDLGVVANMADDIAVMYAGKIVEFGTAEEIFYDPRHPYTWALLGSMPDLDTKEKLHAIPGTPPNMLLPPKGDAFASRNEYALKIDEEAEPPLFMVSDTHYAATWMLHEYAPDVEVPAIVSERIKKALKGHPEAMPHPTNMKNSVLNYIKEGHK